MGDGSDAREGAPRGGGGAGGGVGGGAEAPPRPSRADLPPTDGEIAARRLIAGHLDTTGLDAVSARAVELLAYADMVAAEGYTPKPRRLWRDPLWWVALSVLGCLVLLSIAMLLIVHRAAEGKLQRDRLQTISEQNRVLLEQVHSCVDPKGECAQRGARTTSEAVAALNRATQVIVKCADRYDGDAAIDACIARELNGKG